MKSHEIDYQIIGNEMQIIEIELDENEIVIAEGGAMNYMESGIKFEAKLGDGSSINKGMFENILSAGKRILTGESLFLTHFNNTKQKKQKVAFSAPFPGKIIAIDLKEFNNQIICQKNAFLCAALGTKVDLVLNKKLGKGLFGGEGFILQSLKGDGKAFLHAGGTIIKKELNNEELLIDTGSLVAFSSGIDYDIQYSGKLKSMMFSGEGFFMTTLSGTGTVYLQSLPFNRFVENITSKISITGGGLNDSSSPNSSLIGNVIKRTFIK